MNRFGRGFGNDSVLVGNKICYLDSLTNNGDGDLIITSFSITGLNDSDFSVIGLNPPLTLRPHSFHLIEICETPNKRGLCTATLTINADSSIPSSITTILQIYGLGICDSVSPKELFSGVEIAADGQTDTTQCITFVNCGDLTDEVDIEIRGAIADITEYTITHSFGFTYAGKIDTICVTFKPTHRGMTNASLDIGLPTSVIIIPLHGTGVLNSVRQESTNHGFSLGQNFPNPSTGITTFSYTIPTESEVHLSLSDVTGRTVRTIARGRISGGEHSITFDASGFPSGSYIISLASGDIKLTKELMLTK